MSFGERFKSFNIEPSNVGNTHENLGSFEKKAALNNFKEERFSFVSFPAVGIEKKTMPQTMMNQMLNLNSGSPFSQMKNVATNEKSRKRPYSKPCPKSKKKKMLFFNDEERNLDNDLIGLAGSINTDKNLDSSCSNDSIELNDMIIVHDDNPFSPQAIFNDVNSHKGRNSPTSAFLNNSLKSYISTDGAKHRTFAVEKKKGGEVKSCVPVFKEIMPSSFSRNNSSSTSSTLHSNLLLNESNKDKFSTTPKSAKKKESTVLEDNASKVRTSDPSPISNNSSEVCQSNKTLNYQSIYASMGLDEDLCDTEQASNKVLNSVSKATIDSAEKLCNFSEVKIKTEDGSSLNVYNDKRMKDDKNENLTLDGYHVSWTFEEETPCDDGEEEDVPLVLLKNKSADVINSQRKSASIDLSQKTNITGNKMHNFPPPLFIKKELIEDEIVSESKAVSLSSVSPFSNTKSKTNVNSLPVEIKEEPIDVEYFPDNSNTTNILTSFDPSNDQLFANKSTRSSDKTLKKKMPNTPKSPITTDIGENGVLSRLLQCENPSTAINANKHNFSGIAESVNSTQSYLPEFPCSVKPVAKKTVSKKKVAKKKAKSIIEGLANSNFINLKCFTQGAPSSELPEIPQTPSSNNLLTESASNSNNFNNDKKSSIDKINDTIEAVIRKSVKMKKQVKAKTVSKKSDPENISLHKSGILATDNETVKIQEKYATDSDTESALETESLLNLDNEKRKRESIEKDMNIDENVPITLLIKRQKSDTDTNPAGSFLCTSIPSRSSAVESSSVYNDRQGLDIDQCEEISLPSNKKDISNDVLSPAISNISQPTKRKRTGKKKVSKKKAKKTLLTQVTENEVISTGFSSPIKESNPSVYTALKETFSEKNKVKKGNNEFHSESATMDGFTDQSSQENIYITPSSCGAQSEGSLSSTSFQTSISGDVNSQTERSNLNSPAVPSKKKKRRQRSNGWYKKKKSKKDRQKSRKKVTTDRVEIQNPVLDASKDPPVLDTSRDPPVLDTSRDALLLTVKSPIVVIKNLNSEIHNIESCYMKAIYNTAETQNAESNPAENNNAEKISTEILEKLPVTSSSKVKKKKANKSRKKKKPRVTLKSSYVENENEDTLEALSVSESNKISTTDSIETVCLQDEFSDASKENSKHSSLEEIIDESGISRSQKKDSTKEFVSENNEVTIAKSKDSSVDSNAITNMRGGFCASLNVEALEKQIEEWEALIGSKNNCDNLGQNIDNSSTSINDTSKNMPELSVQSKNSDSVLNSIAAFETVNNIPFKEEINDGSVRNPVNQVDESISQLNPFRAALIDQESTANAARSNCISPLISIKKEKVVESQSTHKNKASECTNSCTSTLNRTSNQTDSPITVENANKLDSIPDSVNISCSSNLNSIGLAIKKEVTHNAKSVSNISLSDQNELIQQVHASSSKSPSTNFSDTSKRNFNRYLPESDYIPESQKKSLDLLNDDEIQVLPMVRREIPLIELDDGDDLCNVEQRIQENISEYDSITNISKKFIELSKRIKTEKDDSKSSSVVPEESTDIIPTSSSSKQISSFSFSKGDEIRDSVDPSKIRTVVSDSNFVCTGSYVSEDPIKRETSNPFVVRDKYINAYFKHPFPPSQTCYKKRRNRSKMYERIESTAWNLSVDEVESRLKHSENTMPQFGKKLGDIVKLEKYPVSKSEVECYHRILGVAPSHKLLSKCYLTPNHRFLTGFNSLFNKFDQSEMEAKEATSLSINDLLQGIAESKAMSTNFDGEKNLIAFDRDCPSAENKDSFDSSTLHSTEKYTNAIPDKNVEQPSSQTLKQNELNTTSDNISLISQNSSLSCITNSEDVSNHAVTNIDTSSNAPSDYETSSVLKSNDVSNLPYLQNNILANLNLPSKEVVNSILNSTGTSHLTAFKTSDIATSCSTESTNTTTVNIESPLPPNHSHLEAPLPPNHSHLESPLPPNHSHLESVVSSEVNTNLSQSLTKTNIFDIINLPVVELRKILDTAKTLPSSSNDDDTLQSDNTNDTLLHDNVDCDNLHSDSVSHDGIWKRKETFEYNHTQRIPDTNDSDQNRGRKIDGTEVSKVKDGFSESIEDTEEQTRNENSDDEYVDNEPMHYNSDNEKSDSSSHENEEQPIPQYKSKWEKIMERKSQELKEKEKINELYLNDCVPVSSRLRAQSKKNSIYSKVSEFSDKKSEDPKENESSKVQKNKPNSKKLKQPELKNKTETEGEKTTKSLKTSKKIEKKNSKPSDPRTAKKDSSEKNKSKELDEVSNLFEVPDKLVKSPVKKPATSLKSNEKKEKSKFYGNRVTNRGTFLTEATPAKGLANIKIPKKVPETTAKKSTYARSEEFHSMVKSPDININLPRMSSGRNYNRNLNNRKNSDEYRSPLSNTSPSVTLNYIRTKRMRDRQNAYVNSRSHYAGKKFSDNKEPLLPVPYPKPSPYLNDETVQNRNPPLKIPTQHQESSMSHKIPVPIHHQESSMGHKIPVPIHHQESSMGHKIPVPIHPQESSMGHKIPVPIHPQESSMGHKIPVPIHHQESSMGHKIPVLCSPTSSSPQTLLNMPSNPQENFMGHKIPVLCSPSSSSSQVPSDSAQSSPSKALLQKIMSMIKTNPSEMEDNTLPYPENIDAAWDNQQYNSPYAIAEPPISQNMNSQPNLSFDSVASVSNPFRNIAQVDSLNLQRTTVGSQHNINFPFNSPTAISTPLVDSLDPRRTSLGLQSNMLSNSIPGSSALTETLDPRRAALGLQPSMLSSADPLGPRTALMSQPNIPVSSLMSSNLINIPLSENLDPRKAAFAIHQTPNSSKKSPEIPFNTGSQILNSPPHIAPMASATQQPSRKATCLVPSHLKTLVGHQTVETHNVRLLMLEWSVDWLIQQQKLHDPPPISNALKKVSSSYDSFEDYYNTYFPLMLLETWHRIYVSWTHLNQTAPFLCQITSYSVKNQYVSVECQTLFSTDNRRKGIFPDEGSILMVKYSTKSNEYTIKILGYVTHVKTRRYNPVTDSKICSSLSQHINVNPDSLQILTLTFMGAYNSEDIDKRQPVRIHVLCTVKHNLKQNDAMLYINKSPLQRSILNPVADGLLTFSLTPRNSPEERVNECVRDITKGILSPHPLPLLTVVRAKPESDRLNIIPLLIQKMKTAYKTKVLLCVRTVRALGDIAANICLQQSLKLVIINKRCDTNLQFQKYLLDELVSSEAKKMEEGAIGDKKLSSEACIKIKKQIIKDCDVILSLIRNSHDDFLDQTFQETESIAQMCCIVDEANLCTEPETLIPILHGISKLILIGDPDYTAEVLSETASAYDFNQSFFQRAYDLDLLTE